MSLAERLANAKPKESGLPCGISRVLEQMNSEDQEALQNVLFTTPRTISNRKLQEILIEEGYNISHTSVALHRRKQCRCFVGRASTMAAST